MSTMHDDAPPPSRRVAVMLEDGAAHAVLQAAAELAQLLNVDLAGWFVEDARLLELAQLPFACEADWTSATVRPLQAASLERAARGSRRKAPSGSGARRCARSTWLHRFAPCANRRSGNCCG